MERVDGLLRLTSRHKLDQRASRVGRGVTSARARRVQLEGALLQLEALEKLKNWTRIVSRENALRLRDVLMDSVAS